MRLRPLHSHPAGLVVTCAFLLAATPARAPAQTQITTGVVGAGGGEASSPSFGLRATVGQPAVGKMQSTGYRACAGYWYGPFAVATAVIDIGADLPRSFHLDQNYPNPFNPSTTIRFALPLRTHVKLAVYDVAGRPVAVLVDDVLDAGVHTATFAGGTLASGIYFYRLETSQFVRTRKLVVLK